MKLILVDTNVFSKVFDKTNQKHEDYKAVYETVVGKRNVKIVGGGTKFTKELSGITIKPYDFQKIKRNYQQKLLEYKKARLLDQYADNEVDDKHVQIIEKFCDCYNEKKTKTPVNPEEILRNKTIVNKIKNKGYSQNEFIEVLIDELQILPDFDDPHIIALLEVSNCKNVITYDERAMPFFKEKCLYSNSVAPKIHTDKSLKKSGLKMQ